MIWYNEFIFENKFKTNQYRIEIILGQFQGPRSIFQDKFELGHLDS